MKEDQFRGSLLGLAVGDALGAAVEFKAPGSFEPVTDMRGGGPFSLPIGAWTDDTSMALCLAESLIEKESFDPIDQLERYVSWYRKGHLSSTGSYFDIGEATRGALHRFERSREPYPGDADLNAAGNGPLMRLAPLALAYANYPVEAVRWAGESARTTHGSPQARDACRYFAGLIVGTVRGANVSELLHQGIYEPVPGIWDSAPLHPEIEEVAAGSFHGREPPEIKGVGYVVRALEAALWALMKTRNFEDGVLMAVNLGDDADTTAAIYGQLAGAIYGADGIPERWREQLVMSDEITEFADRLLALATSIDPTQHSDPPTPPPPGDSYWVLPCQVLAGPYPGAESKAEAREKLSAFLDLGITCFIDLTEEGEGPPLHPYAQLLAALAKQRNIRVSHIRIPIPDTTVPLSWQMRAILGTIRAALSEGETVYLHCWGGVGRTGTVIGSLLVEEGERPAQVLATLKDLRKQTERAHRLAPETHEQRSFVESWRGAETLVTDQQGLEALDITPVDTAADNQPTSVEAITAELVSGQPVVLNGPVQGQCVQAIAAGNDAVRVEVLDPVHWESGAPLPEEQQKAIENHAFAREDGMWIAIHSAATLSEAATRAGQQMVQVLADVWGAELSDPEPD